jgi:hypothetical protein
MEGQMTDLFIAHFVSSFASCLFAVSIFSLIQIACNKFFQSSVPKSGVISLPKFNKSLDFEPVCSSLDGTCSLKSGVPDLSVPKLSTFEDNVKNLEETRNSRLVFITTKESNGLLSKGGELTMSDARNFVNTLRSIPEDKNIDIVVDTPGGYFCVTEVIVDALKSRKNVNVFIPFRATSAGTLISLCGDKVFLGRNAFLGPVDSQWNGFSVAAIARHLPGEGMFSPLWNYMREVCQKDARRTNEILTKISSGRFSVEDERFQKTFVNATVEHDKPLFYDDVSFLGYIQNSNDFPQEIYDIFDQYQKKTPVSSGGLLGSLF